MNQSRRRNEVVVPFDRPPKRASVSWNDDADGVRNALVARLYRQHWGGLCARLRRAFGNGPPEPEDLAQIAFTKFLERADPAQIERPEAYLFRIAINAARDRLRHIGHTRRIIEEHLGPLHGDEVDRITPSSVYEARERLAITIAALDTLSAKQKEVLVRSRIHGETFDQIRAGTGWSKADISRTLQSVMATLQAAARAHDDGGA